MNTVLIRIKPIVFLILLLFVPSLYGQSDVSEMPLRNFRPQSVYKTPSTDIKKPAFPIIDMHSHDYAESREDIEQWVETMDYLGIEKTVILSGQTGAGFDSLLSKYSDFTEKFEFWCGLDFTGYGVEENWIDNAVKELERCYSLGAKGVGELGDKGEGFVYSKPSKAYGLHINDPEMKPLLDKCAELKMPVNIHVAEPIWMYEKIDSTNDGLMNAYDWRIDLSNSDILNHAELITTLDQALENNPNTRIIACHFANCSYDLNILANLLDKHPNFWADISARYAETAPIPKFTKNFYNKYQDRLLYGTDMGMDEEMYKITFRILETDDEHFYEIDQFNYHWPLYGFGLSAEVLEKLYKTNALRIIEQL